MLLAGALAPERILTVILMTELTERLSLTVRVTT